MEELIKDVWRIANENSSVADRWWRIIDLFVESETPIVVRDNNETGDSLNPLLEMAWSYMFEQEIRRAYEMEVLYTQTVASLSLRVGRFGNIDDRLWLKLRSQ